MSMTIKAARINAGLTQAEAAKLLDICVNTLGRYESGKSCPDIKTVKKMEKAYNVSYADLIFLP